MQDPESHPQAPPRRPGELTFHALVVLVSLWLLWTAYGISGFDALSGAGALPMAATAVMLITAVITFVQALQRSGKTNERLIRDILPLAVMAIIGLIAAYAVALQPIGFLPTSFVFLVIAIKMLSRRSLGWAALMSFISVAVIYLIFRLVFSVLMPAGVVPEAEILAALRGFFGGGN
ncbi:MAG: tripartite tricarboxylate transporter TctB family protein [Pseudorhodobacter sp.]